MLRALCHAGGAAFPFGVARDSGTSAPSALRACGAGTEAAIPESQVPIMSMLKKNLWVWGWLAMCIVLWLIFGQTESMQGPLAAL